MIKLKNSITLVNYLILKLTRNAISKKTKQPRNHMCVSNRI